MKLLETEIEPDIEGLIDVIRRRGTPKRVHNIELFLDAEVKEIICERFGIGDDIEDDEPFAALKRDVELHRFLGYDAFRVPVGRYAFSAEKLSADDTTAISEQSRGSRQWLDEHTGSIKSWKDLEAYPWPKVSDIDFGALEWMDKNLPENMGCYDLTAHVLERATTLFGYESLCYLVFDEPDLVNAVFQKAGEFYVEYTRALCDFDSVRLIWGSDDMGFRTSTMVSDNILREKVFPWHRRCADISHEHGKPYLLHACGQLDEVMTALIEDVTIDARHSYEDTILPVTEAKKRYGEQIAILGGIDVDFLCRSDEKSIRKRVRQTLQTCMPGGGYCLGTGNTVANYIPVENYLVMLDEGRRFSVSSART